MKKPNALAERISLLDTIDVKEVLEESDIQVEIVGGLDGSPREEIEDASITFDIEKFRRKLIEVLERK